MNKEAYARTKLKVTEFEQEDVITTSSVTPDLTPQHKDEYEVVPIR